MAAEPIERPERDPKHDAEVFIAEYQEKYGIALSIAREAMVTTDSAAWQRNYADQRRAHRERIQVALDHIVAQVEFMRKHDADEDSEKGVKDAIKAIQGERESFAAWTNRAVAPFKLAAENAAEMRGEPVRMAKLQEMKAPMLSHGLADEVQAIVTLWPEVSWDDDAGTVSINDSPNN